MPVYIRSYKLENTEQRDLMFSLLYRNVAGPSEMLRRTASTMNLFPVSENPGHNSCQNMGTPRNFTSMGLFPQQAGFAPNEDVQNKLDSRCVDCFFNMWITENRTLFYGGVSVNLLLKKFHIDAVTRYLHFGILLSLINIFEHCAVLESLPPQNLQLRKWLYSMPEGLLFSTISRRTRLGKWCSWLAREAPRSRMSFLLFLPTVILPSLLIHQRLQLSPTSQFRLAQMLFLILAIT